MRAYISVLIYSVILNRLLARFTITCAGIIPPGIPVEGLSAKEVARKLGGEIEIILAKIRELVKDGTIKV